MERDPGAGDDPGRWAVAVEPAWLRARLVPVAQAAGVSVEPEAWIPLARYASLLLAWRARINLTGATTPEALADEHLADALFLVPHLPGPGARLADVGSGAGLPGLVLAILRPKLSVTLIEPAAKRHTFLRAARRALERPEIAVEAVSLEAHLAAGGARAYEVAVSRATWPVAEWLQRGERLVRPGGVVLGLEGEALASLPPTARRHPYRLAGRPRAVISMPASSFHVER